MRKKTLITLFIGISIISCNIGNKEANKIPEMLNPNWDGIETKNLKLKFGQIVTFKKENEKIRAIVLDFNKDEKGIWYGLCFFNNNKLFGRKVPNGLVDVECMKLIDLTYLNEKGLGEFEIISNEKLDLTKIGIGSTGSALTYSDLLRNYSYGLKKRLQKETPCNDILNSRAIRECYFGLSNFK